MHHLILPKPAHLSFVRCFRCHIAGEGFASLEKRRGCRGKGKNAVDPASQRNNEEASCLETETGLAPVPPLGVVAINHHVSRGCPVYRVVIDRWVVSYRMVLPVRRRIHWGMGRFCFWALASFCLVLKVFWLCVVAVVSCRFTIPVSNAQEFQLSLDNACTSSLVEMGRGDLEFLQCRSSLNQPSQREVGVVGCPQFLLFVAAEQVSLRCFRFRGNEHTGILTGGVGFRALW